MTLKNEVESQTSELREKIVTLDAELTEDFKSQLAIVPFLSRKLVSFQGNKDKPAYNWYKYKEAFSAELVTYFLSQYEGGTKGKVLDPFAGIGTTLFAASEQNIHATGIELLPIGQEIIQTRLLLQSGLTTSETAILEHWIALSTMERIPGKSPIQYISDYRRGLSRRNGRCN